MDHNACIGMHKYVAVHVHYCAMTGIDRYCCVCWYIAKATGEPPYSHAHVQGKFPLQQRRPLDRRLIWLTTDFKSSTQLTTCGLAAIGLAMGPLAPSTSAITG